MDDFRLIEGLQQEGLAGRKFEDQLYIVYNYFIREGCNKYNLSEEDGFSAYSDAVIAVINSIRSRKFEGRSSLKTYLFQIFCNKCVDTVRRNTADKAVVHRAEPIDAISFQMPDNVSGIVEKIMQKINRNIIMQNLKEMGEKCRSILLLFEEGFSDREIAARMSYETAAVAKTSRLRCLEKLRTRIPKTSE